MSEFMRHNPEENEDFQMAHKLMSRYADSLVDEYKAKKENAFLIESMDKIFAELQDVKGELSEIKQQNAEIPDIKAELSEIRQQNAELTESMQYIDFTRLTVGRGNAVRRKPMSPDDNFDAYIPHFSGKNGQGPWTNIDPNEAFEPDMQHTTRLPKLKFEEYDNVFNPKEDEAAEDAEPAPPAVLESIEDIELGDMDELLLNKIKKKPKNLAVTIISNVLFYACMALLIIGAITFAQSDDVEKSVFGFRYYYIKTASMEPDLPVGSVVLTRVTPPEDIKIGDDITVYIGDGKDDTYLTHRVVEVLTENGEISFRTKGVNNKSNDPTPFSAALLTGKVILCVPFIGTVMTFVQTQLIFVIGIFVLLLLLSFMLRLLFSKEDPAKAAEAAATAPAADTPKQSRRERKAEEKRMEQEMLRKITESHAARRAQSSVK